MTPKKKKEDLLKRGRKTLYKPEYCEMLIAHADTMLSFEAFAGMLGVSRECLYEWERVHPEFYDAKRIFLAKSQGIWEKAGVDGLYNQTFKDADGMTVSKSINASIWIFSMKNRFKWTDRNEIKQDSEQFDKSIEDKKAQQLEEKRRAIKRHPRNTE